VFASPVQFFANDAEAAGASDWNDFPLDHIVRPISRNALFNIRLVGGKKFDDEANGLCSASDC
jgi:hypothetical protein